MATDGARIGTRTGEQPRERVAELKQDRPLIQRAWDERAGLWGAISTAQSGRNGLRLMAIAFLFLLVGGLNAALMRIQLAQPNNSLVTPEQYNQLFTMHGSTMMFFFIVPFMQGAALVLLPLVIGAREVPWPRLTSFVFWTFLIGGLLFEASWLFGAAPDAGWTAYPPLSDSAFSPEHGLDFWLLALLMVSVAGVLSSAVLITTVFKSRAPGMSIGRMPLLAWAILAMALTMFVAFVVVFCAGAMLEMDRKLVTHIYSPDGGNPLLWQYLFWIFGHPLVYVQFIPAAGLTSMALPVIIRQRIIGRGWLVAAFLIMGLLTFGLGGDQAAVSGASPLGVALFVIGAGTYALLCLVQISAWLATIRRGAGKWNTAYLFILGFVFLSLIGGVTAVMLSLFPFAVQVQNSYFAVANLHYILIGTVVFPIFAGLYYWFPKFTGRFLGESLGKWNFWLMFVGFNLAFFPMFISGLYGMPRRIYTYPSIPELNALNLVSTIGAVILASGVLVGVVNLLISLANGQAAGSNPWGGDSLEWAADSPLPDYRFQQIPIVESRHPLWDQERLDAGSDRSVRLVERLAEWPATWRAALLTSTRGGEPEEVYRVAGPSAWPFVAAIGTALVFVSFFFDQLLFLAILIAALVVLAVALAGWHMAEKQDSSVSAADIEEFKGSYGVELALRGSPILKRWALTLAVAGLVIILAVGGISYLLLRA